MRRLICAFPYVTMFISFQADKNLASDDDVPSSQPLDMDPSLLPSSCATPTQQAPRNDEVIVLSSSDEEEVGKTLQQPQCILTAKSGTVVHLYSVEVRVA